MSSEDRRAAIEAAFNASEEGEGEGTAPPSTPVLAPADEGLGEGETVNEEVANKPVLDPIEPRAEKVYSTDKPPQSWKPAQKAKWEAVDPEVRSEVIRREREIERTLGDTAQARQLAQGFTQAVQPFMARIQSMGMHPVAAVQELFRADHILTTAPKSQRAAFMAKLIADYDVDVVELDKALSGQATVDDPVQSAVDKLLQERLQPFQTFMQQQTQQSEAQRAAEMATMQTQMETMASDPKYPEFDNVREDMADVIDIQAKRGVYLTLEQAYSRAIAMNPEVSARVRQQTDQAHQSAAARAAHARAQKALKASQSVGGAPGTDLSGATTVNDRRATIAAAFDQAEGR